MKAVRLLTFLPLLLAGITVTAAEPLDAFPVAEEGMERFVIVLPQHDNGQEEKLQVEIIVGREMLTDGVNRQRLGNSIEPRSLKGWGYTYYKVTGSSQVISTLMAAPEGVEKVKSFVSAPSLFVRYNSRLPIVVYAPTGYQVHYRFWQAGEERMAEKK